MKILVESGATKTDWCALAADGSLFRVKSAGMNVATMSPELVRKIFEETLPQVNPSGEAVSDIHFYAAGIIRRGAEIPDNVRTLDTVFRSCFPDAEIEYASDLLAAARAVCGRKPGIAAILGTGSNSCFYDGTEIVKNVRSAGFILGDEGGAARLGRLFLADFLKDLVPERIAAEFAAEFPVDYLTVVENVYKNGAPARYLGSFAPWILARYPSSAYIRTLVEGNFRDFCTRALKQYDISACPVGVVGGFGIACEEIIRKVGASAGIRFSRFIPSPIDGLIEYHSA